MDRERKSREKVRRGNLPTDRKAPQGVVIVRDSGRVTQQVEMRLFYWVADRDVSVLSYTTVTILSQETLLKSTRKLFPGASRWPPIMV